MTKSNSPNSPKRDPNGRFISGKTKPKTKKPAKGVKVHVQPPKAGGGSKGITYIEILVDSSGSMGSIKDDTVQAVNANLQIIAQNAKSTGRKTLVGLSFFNSAGWVNTVRLFDKVDSDSLPLVRPTDYNPTGGTPLFKATRQTIEKVLAYPFADSRDTNFLVEIVTDGVDTHGGSMELNALVRTVQGTDRWTLSFMLPKGEKHRFCETFSVPEGNVTEWDTTAKGLATLSVTLNASTGHFYQQTLRGQFASKGFFTPDLSKLKVSEVKRELQDLSSNIRVLSVEKEAEIREFCVGKMGSYRAGNAYYQLTKSEKVAANKQIMLLDNTSDRIYGGQEARDLIGLQGDTKIKPGNMGNYGIYIQSLSSNRILCRGTKLLYVK